jgi:hypothetical protein
MSTKKTRGLPARLEGVRRRFQNWRQTRKSRSARIPDPLWAAAVKMAGAYGIHRTARALRLDYYSLKERVEATLAATASNASAGAASATFLELPPSAWAGSCECTLELEDVGGATMRVHLKGAAPPDLAALSRSFWELD